MNNNKTVLITGASRGIGYSLAKQFAQRAYRLVLVSRNPNILKEIQDNFISEFNTDVIIIVKDLAQPNAALEILQELNTSQITIDILVNNAGIGDFSEFYKEDYHKIIDILQLNIVTLTELTRIFLQGMVERKEGKILNVSSLAAFLPGPYMAVYYASKAYVKSFSEAIANELKGTGVTVTALCPGLTKTGFQHEVGSENSNLAKLNLMTSADEVAKYGIQALLEGKEVAIPGVLNTTLAITTKFIPSRLKTKLIGKMQELNRKKFVFKPKLFPSFK